ncbi:MAG: response regulator [Pseudonocardiaceae bacterium]
MGCGPVLTAVILDDHPAVTAGVEAWCTAADPPIRLIDAGDRLAHVWTEPGCSADVVIFDLQLGGRPPAFHDLGQLVKAGRTVIVYSQRADNVTALTCLDLGAFTYLTKAEGKAHLIPAIHAAAHQLPYTSPSLGGALGTDNRPGRPVLSARETEVLLAWFECASKKLVAAKLYLSVKTVETHIDRVRSKYAAAGRDAPTKTALFERAQQDGIIDLP